MRGISTAWLNKAGLSKIFPSAQRTVPRGEADQSPAISIIIPAYNAEAYLSDTLRSIEIQSEKDFEVLVVDDGSTDGTRRVVNHFVSGDPRFHYIYQKNGGAGSARNTGFSRAKGTYVTFVDADDVLTPDALEHLYWHAEKYKNDITIGAKKKVKKRTKKFYPELFKNRVNSARPEQIPFLRYHVAPHAKFFRRKFLVDAGISFIEGYTYEDFLHSCCVFTKAEKVGIVNEVCYYYIVRDTSISMSGAKPFNVISRIKVETEIWAYLDQHAHRNSIFPKPKNTTFRYRLMRHIRGISDASNPDHRESFEILKAFCTKHWEYIEANTFSAAFHLYSAMINNDLADFINFKNEMNQSTNFTESQGLRHLSPTFLDKYNVSTARNGRIKV